MLEPGRGRGPASGARRSASSTAMRLEAAADDAGEAAGACPRRPRGSSGRRPQRYEHGVAGSSGRGRRPVQRADQREGGEVDALGAQAGGADGGAGGARPCRGGRRRARRAGAGRRAGVDDAERLEVEDRGSSGIGIWSCAWKRTRGLELLAVLDGRQLDEADDDLLVGDADADALVRGPCCRGRARAGRRVRASASTTSPSRTTPGSSGANAARSTFDAAVDGDLGDGDAAGLDVEADEVLRACACAMEKRGRDGRGGPARPHRQIGRADLSPGPRSGACRTCVQRLGGSEAVEVGVHEPRRPTNSATTPPSARNGPNGTAVLRPSARALAGDDHGADDDAGDERDEDRRRDGAAQVEAQTPASLTSPMPIPRG